LIHERARDAHGMHPMADSASIPLRGCTSHATQLHRLPSRCTAEVGAPGARGRASSIVPKEAKRVWFPWVNGGRSARDGEARFEPRALARELQKLHRKALPRLETMSGRASDV
jgi:hypothetical protein